MKLAWILWLSQFLPQPAADSLCLSTTVYLEARNQTVLGQEAVAEVALRRLDSGVWGHSLCGVVTARKQFAPTLVSPKTRMDSGASWNNAIEVALSAERNWDLPASQRKEVVPGASHFVARALAHPRWGHAHRVAVIGDHTFYRVRNLTPRIDADADANAQWSLNTQL